MENAITLAHTSWRVACICALVLLVLYVRSNLRWKARSKGKPFPPGPQGFPLIGNLLNSPTFKAWLVYRDLCLKYGDVIHFRVLGQSIVVLGSTDAINEFLEKRSATTSDRQQSVNVELCGADVNMTFTPYGQRWRRHRRAFWQHFHRDAAVEYHPTQRAVSHVFLAKLLDTPHDLKEHIRYTFAAAILKTVYGLNAAEEGDEYLSLIEPAMEGIARGLIPGKFMVEFFPFLRHVPEWVPGAGFQALFKKWRTAANTLKDAPFDRVKVQIDLPEIRWSVIGRLLSRVAGFSEDRVKEEEEVMKNVGAVAFEGGTDTTFNAMLAAFVALSLHPGTLKKAQDELDAVVGPHRLPEFEDKESLVYVNAIIMETLRWHTVTPFAAPHCTIADEELRGYFIPKGTVILPNVWACTHDPDVFPDPDVFRPERFIKDGRLDPGQCDPIYLTFGFGRRICPGRYFALNALFINLSSVMHVFNITQPLDERSMPIEIERGQTDGLLSRPVDCRCRITPRSLQAEELIRSHATASRVGRHV